jgi:hypothetical protein
MPCRVPDVVVTGPDSFTQTKAIRVSRLEHKAEHNNCQMRGSESDLKALGPSVSALLRVRAARMIHLLNRCTG